MTNGKMLWAVHRRGSGWKRTPWLLLHVGLIGIALLFNVGGLAANLTSFSGDSLYIYHRYGDLYADAFCVSGALLPVLLGTVFPHFGRRFAVLVVATIVSLLFGSVCLFGEVAIVYGGAGPVQHLDSLTVDQHVYHLARQAKDEDGQLYDLAICRCDASGYWCTCRRVAETLLEPEHLYLDPAADKLLVKNNADMTVAAYRLGPP